MLKKSELPHVHASIFYNSQGVEAIHVSIDEWINKMCYLHTVEYYSALTMRAILTHAATMDEPWGHSAKWNKPIKDPYSVEVSGDWGEDWGVLLNGCRASLLQDEEFWRQMVVMAAQQWLYGILMNYVLKMATFRVFSGGSVVKNASANAGNMDSIPGLGRSHMPQCN